MRSRERDNPGEQAMNHYRADRYDYESASYAIEFNRLHRAFEGNVTHSWTVEGEIDFVTLNVDLGGDEPVDMVTLTDGRVIVVGLYDGWMAATIFAILDDAHYSIDGVELAEI